MTTDWLRVDDINVGARLRQDLGDIAGLAKSIDEYGLLHPLVIDADNNLIAGGRRLEAMKSLGWTKVEVRQFEEMTPDERRVLELEENLRRKDLTPAERSQKMAEQADVAERVDRRTGEIFSPEQTSEDNDIRVPSTQKSERGRPSEPGSLRRVADMIGVSEGAIRKARRHVDVADRYPILQKPEWTQSHALQVGETLDRLPDGEREDIAAVLQEQAVPPDTAMTILQTWNTTPQPQRDEIRQQLKSTDDRQVSAAKARLVNEPPPPNKIITGVEDIVHSHLNGALKRLQGLVDAYPDDPAAEDLRVVISAQRSVVTSLKGVIARIEREGKHHVGIAAD